MMVSINLLVSISKANRGHYVEVVVGDLLLQTISLRASENTKSLVPAVMIRSLIVVTGGQKPNNQWN